nr:ribonuclease H-like domain-containing protein [Tanacetum cinerariifolium]
IDQQNPTLAKIPILDTGKFVQWQFRIQQYLQHEHYALWEVTKFRDSYEVPASAATTGTANDKTGKKKGRTVTVTADDIQKRKNDVKARTTLLLSLPDEHQLRFSKYKTAQEVWAAILKIFGGNEATKKTKKNLLKQYLAPEWLVHTIVWRNRSDLDTMSLDDLYNHLKNMALLSMRADRFWKKTGKKISIQGSDMAGFDKSKVEYFNCHKMCHFAIEYRAPRSQDRGRRDNYRQGSKVKEHAPKALMAIAGVFDNSLCSKDYKKNTDSLNSKITDLTYKLFDAKNMIYHYKLGLVEVESRLAEHKDREIKYCEKIRGLEYKTESSDDYIKILKKELELIKKEKEGLDSKLTGFQTASKDLDSLLESQRLDMNKEGLGYSVVPPPPPAQIYSSPKKDMSWTGLLEFKDNTVTDYSRPAPTVESSPDDAQNKNPSVTETEASPSTISPKSFIKFVKANDSPTNSKTDKAKTAKKPPVKKFSTVNRKFPTANRKFPTGDTKFSTADMGKKGKTVNPSACWFGSLHRTYLPRAQIATGSSQNNIDDKGYWDSGCSRHMIGNISYLSDYKPFDRGYVSFGQGGCKIAGKRTIKTECIVLGQNFKLSDDDNVLLRTPIQHNMYSIDLHNIVPHKDLTCLVAKASIDESMFFRRSIGTRCWDTLSNTPPDSYSAASHFGGVTLGLSQVEARLVEFKNQEIKFCGKIRGLEFKVESKTNRIECLTNELEMLKKEKGDLDSKLTGFKTASKDLDNLLGSQRTDKNKEGLGYSAVPPSYSSLLSSQKGHVLDRIAKVCK